MDLIGYVMAAVAMAAAVAVAHLLGKVSNKITYGLAKRIDNRVSKTRREGLTAEFDMK